MPEQIASLGIAIDSRQVEAGAVALGRLDTAARTAEQSANRLNVAHRNAVAANENLARASRQAGEQVRQLGFQLNDIATGLATGQSPFTILAQQGGQVYQALNGPGGVSAGLKNVGSTITSLLTPDRVAGAALVAAAGVAAVAWFSFDAQQRSLIATVKGLGREAGLTADQLRNIGQVGAARGGLSLRGGTEFAQSIVETNAQINPANIEKLVAGARDFSAFFTRGDLQDGQKRMLELLQGSGQALLDLDKKSNILSLDQRRAVEDAVRRNDANQAAATLLDVINSRTGLWSETTSKLAQNWDKIKSSFSDIMTSLGPIIDKFLTPVAHILEQVSKGASVAAGTTPIGPVSRSVLGSVGSMAGAGTEAGSINPNLFVRPGATAYSPGDPQTIREIGAQSSAGARAVDELAKKLTAARGAVTELAEAGNRQLEPSFQKTSEQTERLKKETDDLARAGIPEIDRIKKLNAEQEILARKLFETGELTRDEREQQSRNKQALDGLTDAQGRRIDSVQRFNTEAEIERRRITDITVEQRAKTAQDAEELRLVGAGIPVEEARARAQAAGNNVRLESNQQITLGNRELEFSRQQIELEGNSLLATAQQRAQANAELAKEQELRRAGRDPSGVDEQAQIRIAGEQARLKQRQTEGQQQFDSIKQAGVSAFSSIATAIASGTKAMDAMTAGAKQLGSALTSGGINQIAQGNFVTGGVEAVVGLGLSFFGADQEKKKAQRQKQLDDAKTQAEEAARKAQEINQAISTYLQRITAAAFAGQADTLENRLAQFDAKAQSERLDALSKGGAAINLLEVALGMERSNIITDWNKKIADDEKSGMEQRQAAIDAILQRQQSAQDRIFAAGIDTTTLTGRMAALERQFARERFEEMKAGGEAMTDLLAAQDAERLRLLKDSSDEWLRTQKAAFDDAKSFLEGALKSIKQYLDSLTSGSQSPLSPAGRLAAARSQFATQLGLAQGGNRDALSGITGYADSLLQASRAMNASSAAFQADFAQVQGSLGALPSQVSPEQFIVNAINKQTDDLSQVFDSIDVNNDGVISRQEATNTFLASIFNELDVNGDGMLQKSELIRLNTGNTATSTGNTDGYTQSLTTYSASINALTNTMVGIQSTMSSQLSTQIQQLTTAVINLTLMTKVVWNTAQLVTYTTNGFGSPQYAVGGYIDGPGSGTSDSVRARVSRGEFITRASSVARIGLPAMNYMNDNGVLPASNNADYAALREEVRLLRQQLAVTGASIVGAANGTTAAVKGAAPKVERRAPGATAGRAA
jgi:Ca2+-binding EF-hand superfamily protein